MSRRNQARNPARNKVGSGLSRSLARSAKRFAKAYAGPGPKDTKQKEREERFAEAVSAKPQRSAPLLVDVIAARVAAKARL